MGRGVRVEPGLIVPTFQVRPQALDHHSPERVSLQPLQLPEEPFAAGADAAHQVGEGFPFQGNHVLQAGHGVIPGLQPLHPQIHGGQGVAVLLAGVPDRREGFHAQAPFGK